MRFLCCIPLVDRFDGFQFLLYVVLLDRQLILTMSGSTVAGIPATSPSSSDGGEVVIPGNLRPRLRPGVEEVKGFDGTLLLFDSAAGTYTKLSGPARAVLAMLDGELTVDELITGLAQRSRQPVDRVGPAVLRFVGGLRQASLLEDVAPVVGSRRARVVEGARRVPVLRLRLGGPFEGEGGLFLRATGSIPSRLAAVVWSLFALAGLTVGGVALAAGGRRFAHVDVVVVIAYLLVQLAVHEGAHAVVCRSAGARVREVGVALWYYVLPIAYVDRTDAYRVQSRWWRTGIAVAGPASDAVFIGVAGALSLSGLLGGTFHVVLVGEALLMMGNVNPLLPSDLEQAFESATGLVTLRGDGLAWVASKVLRVDRPLPATLSGAKRKVYTLYGTACAVYILLGAGLVVASAALVLVDVARAIAS